MDVPASRLKAEIARILEEEGYIAGFKLIDDADRAPAVAAAGDPHSFLKYGPRGENVISGLQRVSRPGRRVYFGRDDVPKVMGGLGTSILTTSRGVMTGRDAVRPASAAKCSATSGKDCRNMSRIGKKPIPVPKGVTVTVNADGVEVKGPKGTLKQRCRPGVDVRSQGRRARGAERSATTRELRQVPRPGAQPGGQRRAGRDRRLQDASSTSSASATAPS